MSLSLIDYGAGNLHSVANALAAAGCDDLAITADPDAVARALRTAIEIDPRKADAIPSTKGIL